MYGKGKVTINLELGSPGFAGASSSKIFSLCHLCWALLSISLRNSTLKVPFLSPEEDDIPVEEEINFLRSDNVSRLQDGTEAKNGSYVSSGSAPLSDATWFCDQAT